MRRIRISAAAAALVLPLVLSSCFSFTSFEQMQSTTEEYEYVSSAYGENTTSVVVENTTSVPVENTTAATVTTAPEHTTAVIVPDTTRAPEMPSQGNSQTESTTAGGTDYGSYTTAQIISLYSAALNKTRAYSAPFSAVKTESFTAEVTDAHPGGALTELLASNIVKLVGSEGQQTLSFSGGRATDSEGESVPVLLPQKGDFSLPVEGVASATISKEGDKTRVKITLVPETVSMGEVPTYNSGAIGYLDTSGMDFKIITISRVDITYTGSVIDAVIRSDGYIESVTYTINMSTYAELSGMGISGYGTLTGTQIESWAQNGIK